jgi:NAD(P)-dependent dehydrogenase (short-subunit alcohol dehydrogenase family)
MNRSPPDRSWAGVLSRVFEVTNGNPGRPAGGHHGGNARSGPGDDRERGRATSPEVAPYCTSKFAIEGLTRALADELPEGMAAIPLNPGVINTDMLQICFGDQASGYPDAREWAEKAVPFLLRLGSRDNGKSLTVS